MRRGGGHGGRPGTRRPAPTQDPARGDREIWITGSKGSRKRVVGARDPKDTRREIRQVEGTGGWRDPRKLEKRI